MDPQMTQTTTDLARRIDQNLEKICKAKFGHVLTQDEWKALPFAVRRELDKQARQKANHSLGQR
jgi:hypothetical protein